MERLTYPHPNNVLNITRQWGIHICQPEAFGHLDRQLDTDYVHLESLPQGGHAGQTHVSCVTKEGEGLLIDREFFQVRNGQSGNRQAFHITGPPR